MVSGCLSRKSSILEPLGTSGMAGGIKPLSLPRKANLELPRANKQHPLALSKPLKGEFPMKFYCKLIWIAAILAAALYAQNIVTPFTLADITGDGNAHAIVATKTTAKSVLRSEEHTSE